MKSWPVPLNFLAGPRPMAQWRVGFWELGGWAGPLVGGLGLGGVLGAAWAGRSRSWWALVVGSGVGAGCGTWATMGVWVPWGGGYQAKGISLCSVLRVEGSGNWVLRTQGCLLLPPLCLSLP